MQDIIETLASLRPNATFLSLKGYTNSANEVSDQQIVFHFSYENALKKSIAILNSTSTDSDLSLQAKTELLASFQASLSKIETTPISEIEDGYTRFSDDNGNHIKGIKYHTATNSLHIFGLVHRKTVKIPGTYKQVKSKPLTIEKNRLRKLCPVSKFRQFIVNPANVQKITVEGISLLEEESDVEEC